MSFMCKARKCKGCVNIGYLLAILFLSIIVVFALGCPITIKPPPKDGTYSSEEWRDLMKRAGFAPLPFPDSKYKPGTIIRVTDQIDYITDLSVCRYPLDEFELRGYFPDIIFNKNWGFDAGATLNITGITAGADFDQIAKVHFKIADHGADIFDYVKLRVWLEDPDNRAKVSEQCLNELLKDDVYLVTESLRLTTAEYSFYNKSGGKILIKTPNLGKLIQFQSNIKHEVTSDGNVVIEQPVYLGVKTVRFGGRWDTLSDPGRQLETGDAKIEELYIKANKK